MYSSGDTQAVILFKCIYCLNIIPCDTLITYIVSYQWNFSNVHHHTCTYMYNVDVMTTCTCMSTCWSIHMRYLHCPILSFSLSLSLSLSLCFVYSLGMGIDTGGGGVWGAKPPPPPPPPDFQDLQYIQYTTRLRKGSGPTPSISGHKLGDIWDWNLTCSSLVTSEDQTGFSHDDRNMNHCQTELNQHCYYV